MPEKVLAPRVLVVIVSTNDGHWLTPCLKALSASTFRPAMVLVVENGCTDDTRCIAERTNDVVRIIKTPKRLGFASCNNLALRLAVENGYDYVYMLNPDTIVHNSAIEKLVGFLEQSPNYGVAGSLQFEYDAADWETLNTWSRITLEEAAGLGSYPRVYNGVRVLDHYYVQGSALLMRSRLIEKIGMLDPVYRTFYEETDFCRRCRLSGHGVGLVMDSKVKHVGGGNWKRTPRQHRERDFLYLRNQFIYFLSLPQSENETLHAAVRLIYSQLRIIHQKLDSVALPLWRYPSVLLAVLARVREIAWLRKRNAQIIAAVDRIAPELIAVGRD